MASSVSVSRDRVNPSQHAGRKLSSLTGAWARAREGIVILIALPFIAVLSGADPQFVGGAILLVLAVATAGYAIAQLMWEAAS